MKLSNFILNFFPDGDISQHSEFEYEKKLSTPFQDDFNKILSWPPNVFLILYSIVEYTDKYRLLVSPQDHFMWDKNSQEKVTKLVSSWNSYIRFQQDNSGQLTDVDFLLKNSMNNIFNSDNFDHCIYNLMDNGSFCESVFLLLLSIDKLFEKIDESVTENSLQSAILKRKISLRFNKLKCEKHNLDDQNYANNKAMNGIVTLKYNVPQSGLTINNLTQNLTFIKPAVKYKSVVNKFEKGKHNKNKYNILFIPWPFEVKEEYFKPTNQVNEDSGIDDYFGFFDYQPAEQLKPVQFLSLILSSLQRVGDIDLIVLPECALSEKQFFAFKDLLFEIFGEKAPSLLSGVFGKNDNAGMNSALLAFIDEGGQTFDILRQEKHHRWFLDRNQLRNYNLSLALDPGKKWWENISIGRRHLTTLKTTDGVRLCPLICEDLARQEPVAQAVRSVGPNLVISLLLDGPQISPRWPGKYAAVLSDDPGSSVLSVTALGMTKRATGLGHDPSSEVALWSEPNKGSETLKVSSSQGGLVIELELEPTKMWSIDGKSQIKPILRKKMHTTVELEYGDRSVPALKQSLIKALKARR
ncbi:conserved hypothetical protein [Vibrio crassostreae]|nr:conserved hypothetical protein [Vibrio crassostreae]CAK3508339.1 conserved hypothetical protein [Vibrio crassostreae]CAK3514856.1 conserved hypothetical protein [Vibrio crassostreae]CAK3547333.1 conserved hypothetical protein [Vibrio crassostreae]CAK3611014.1 conserved hypothetical protein [Vibrio crassostreae]